jgi:extracellular solute-binding protein (family 5)/binding-protein-dependent transport system inner membrane component
VQACGSLPDCLMPSGPQFNGLVYHNPVNPNEIVCDLCDSWTVSPDGKTYTFRLRQAQWHDGQPVTAADIQFSLDRIVEPGAIRVRTGVFRTFYDHQSAQVQELGYIMAARAIGAPAARIIARHLMPNCLAIYLILATYDLRFAIIIEASLSFLGVGVPADIPSWGSMLTAAAQGHVTRAPWAGNFPGLAIFIAVLGFNLLGDALRDALEPRLRGVSTTARLLSRG